jgi:hypothetical protein
MSQLEQRPLLTQVCIAIVNIFPNLECLAFSQPMPDERQAIFHVWLEEVYEVNILSY